MRKKFDQTVTREEYCEIQYNKELLKQHVCCRPGKPLALGVKKLADMLDMSISELVAYLKDTSIPVEGYCRDLPVVPMCAPSREAAAPREALTVSIKGRRDVPQIIGTTKSIMDEAWGTAVRIGITTTKKAYAVLTQSDARAASITGLSREEITGFKRGLHALITCGKLSKHG